MKKEKRLLEGMPAIVWGHRKRRVYLYVHGQCGNKEEAELLARIVTKDHWQVVSVDLPGHGEHQESMSAFVPWNIVPKLRNVMMAMRQEWEEVALYATSIGAYFCLLAFPSIQFCNCLFVSPIVDMEKLIANMLCWANVSEEELEKQRYIETNFGQTLSWEYLLYARAHTITKWACNPYILYGERDHMMNLALIEIFAQRFSAQIQIVTDGEHWFHTTEQLQILQTWLQKHYTAKEVL